MVLIANFIDYEYIDCFSISTNRKARIVKVQEEEFQWLTKKGDLPSKQEVYLRKRQFLVQLETGWTMQLNARHESSRQPIHILYLNSSYSIDWFDIIGLLFTIDPATPTWQPAALSRNLVTA